MSLPPPPPSASELPAAPAEIIPPPPTAEADPVEVHESDVLKRQGRFSWKKFGGDGFMVSLAVHLILGICALFWVVSTYVMEKPKGDPEVFATGAGGGANGDKAKMFEHKLKSRNTQVKMPSRIVSKNANASIALPSAPSTAGAAFASGLSAGGMSKGSGGGSGGGEGTGIGVGKGGGRNLVSLFGTVGRKDYLLGYIYDYTQTRDGKPNEFAKQYNRSNNIPWLKPEVTKFIEGGWKLGSLERYFRGPAELGVSQILIPRSVDSAAPKAFEAEGKMQGSAWIAVYTGKVRCPESGQIRFAGTADNFLALRFNGRNVLAYGCGRDPSPISQVPGLRQGIATGKWITVNKGEWYDVNVLIGDGGGLFSALLYYERKGEEGKKILFRTDEVAWDEIMAQDKGELPHDLDPASPIWTCKPLPKSVR